MYMHMQILKILCPNYIWIEVSHYEQSHQTMTPMKKLIPQKFISLDCVAV